MDKLKVLTEKVKQLSYQYYTLDEPLVTDVEYDALFDELLTLEKELGRRLPDSPTQRVGGEVLSHFEKVQHRVPLYSLDKAQNFSTLEAWDERNKRILKQADYTKKLEYMVELKFDGLTLSLRYKDGYLVSAATRGNGQIGEEILAQVQTIQSVPLKISETREMIVQGEGIMPLSTLEKYNETAATPLKNARNAAAGALRNLDPKVTRSRHLAAYFFNISYLEGVQFKTDEEIKAKLAEEGFPLYKNVVVNSLAEVESMIDEIVASRDSLDFLIDGAVIKINDMEARNILGFTNRFPRWALAYKFEAEEISTTLLDVEWNVGRTGKITPRAILEPVELGGVTIARATLNNIDDIRRKGVHIGSRVLLRRSNDVIPEILGTLGSDEGTTEIQLPTHCPSCNTELITHGVHSFCPNTLSCEPQLVRRIAHYASRDAMDIEGLSEKTALLLLQELDIHAVDDLYGLTGEALRALPGFKEKRSNNLYNAIQKKKEPELTNFIYALGIGNVGIKAAGDLAHHFKDFDKLMNATADELVKIEDIGPITADEIVEFFHEEHIKKSLNDLFKQGVKPTSVHDENVETTPLSGKTVVITGTLSMSRREMKSILEEAGAKVTGSVSKNTDYILIGDNPGSKADQGRALNIEILSEEDLEYLLGGQNE